MKPTALNQRLIWKESMQGLPMLLALLGLCLVFHIIARLAWDSQRSVMELQNVARCITVLFPNLIAIGLPALLFSGERESGTLAWIRTLPVPWHNIVLSKLAICLVSLVAMYAFTQGLEWFFAGVTTCGAKDAWSPQTFGEFGFQSTFSLSLLAASGLMAFVFRSTLAVLLGTIPLICGVSLAIHQLGVFVWGPSFSVDNWIGATMYSASAAFIFVAMFLQARHVIGRPERKSHLAAKIPDESVYRPPGIIPFATPRLGWALVWQHTSQTWPYMLSALAIGIVAGFFGYWKPNDENAGVVFIVPVFSSLLLGTMCFATDNILKRKLFFADRGVNPKVIWTTRIAVPLLCQFLLAGVSAGLFVGMLSGQDRGLATDQTYWPVVMAVSAVMFASFSCGLLSGMLARRVSVGVLCGIALLISLVFAMAPHISVYEGKYIGCMLLGIAVSIAGTLWLVRQWSEDGRSVAMHLKAGGLLFSSLLLIYGITITHRVATVAPFHQGLREQLGPPGFRGEDLVALAYAQADQKGLASPFHASRLGSQNLSQTEGAAAFRKRIVELGFAPGNKRSEIESPQSIEVGEGIDIQFQHFMASQLALEFECEPEWVLAALECRQFEALCLRSMTHDSASQLAETVEYDLVAHLETPFVRHHLAPADWKRLVSRLTTNQQRVESRVRGMANEWPHGESRDVLSYGMPLAEPLRRIERWRSNRSLSNAIFVSLQQMRGGFLGSQEVLWQQRKKAWDRWLGEPDGYLYPARIPTRSWGFIDSRITQLRVEAGLEP